jgi:outer membrane protein with glycine zipper
MRNPRSFLHGVPLVALVSLVAAAASAQVPTSQQLGIYAFPARNQPPEQQRADEMSCYGWAQQQTGIDPTAAPAPVAQADTGPDGSMIKGGARGAAAGTAIGAIAGDTGKGAAIGAVAGGLRGRRQSKEKKKEEQKEAEQQSQAASAVSKETFGKAYGACLEAKGYTVK